MKFSANWAACATACAAIAIAVPALAETVEAEGVEEAAFPRSPVPIAFDGGHELGVTIARQRVLSQNLGYVLTVDAAGEVIECELTRDFRYRATEIALCRPFLKHMTFEPALDADGNPTQGNYTFVLDINTFFKENGDVADIAR